MNRRAGRSAKLAGLVLGVSLGAALLLAGHVPRGSGTLGADVTVLTGPTGELEIPSGPFVHGTDLRSGTSAIGTVPVRNRTGRTLSVRVRALPSITDLDPVLQVRVTTPTGTVYRGTLGGLRSRSGAFTLGSGERQLLKVRLSIPASSSSSGYQGRIDGVTLMFEAAPVGS